MSDKFCDLMAIMPPPPPELQWADWLTLTDVSDFQESLGLMKDLIMSGVGIPADLLRGYGGAARE